MIEFALIVAAVVFLIYFLGGSGLEDSLREGLGCGLNILLFLVLLAVIGIILFFVLLFSA
jgi:hypothetical protein